MDTDVLIVGAGPVGLALAVELGMQGHRCLVVERNDRVGHAPRAKTTNVRSRELFRRWGIADRLAAASAFGVNYPAEVVFATRLAGQEIARFSNAFYATPTRDARFSEHAQWIPQYKVEEVLRERALEFPGVELRFRSELGEFDQTQDSVQAQIKDLVTGKTSTVKARYLVGADGARSSVREQLGISMEGVSPLSHHHNIIFRSPGLAKRHALGPAFMYWLVNPELPAVLGPMDTDDRWSFACERLADSEADPVQLIRTALGIADLDIEILSRDEWTSHQLIATSYRRGNVFLAGDACHLHPPFGGYGMNMGIGDAADLGWKLSAVFTGWGGPALLESYEIERRQMHRRVIDESVVNLAASSRRFALENIESAGPEGVKAREEAATGILAGKRREFDSLGVVLGSCFDNSPVLVEDGTPAPVPDSIRFEPSARPGCLAPHAWIAPGTGEGASLYDHFNRYGLTLLVTRTVLAQEAARVQTIAQQQGIPLTIFAPAVIGLTQLYAADYALIRPDQFVAWRGNDLQDACDALTTIIGAAGGQAEALAKQPLVTA